ncbi:MAG: DCC1-like thiol-disulfide oxidoreductase family protein [Oscillatoria sp. PMC 1068.18]|nr:DCC1-like thiol-disulfide oxidoreductase family protein [Oscillatoria sp. PMC 1076.18]MEC4990523.1 DCC1-like thiol-disulfide oxidoreductase family protein [Oscillatoria sp. PMC 1068.18]
MRYHVIYDGNCNLCVTFTQLLENFDRGKLFNYTPMQDENVLKKFEITPQDCELGMILIDNQRQERRWQGAAAAEEIVNLLPAGDLFLAAYRSLPGVKEIGDRAYEQLRDNRYTWFGKRETTYYSPFGCASNAPESV